MTPLDPRLVRQARATRVHVAASVVLGVLTACLVVAQAEFLSRAIAAVVSDGDGRDALSAVLVGLACVVIGRSAIAWVGETVSVRAAASVKSQLRRDLVRHAAQLGPDSAVSRAEVATLATRGIDALDDYFSQYLPQLFLAVIVPAVVLARLATADLTAAVTVALTLPLIPVFMSLVGRMTEASTARRWRALTRLGRHFLDVVSGLETLKVFGRATAQAASVRETTERYRTTTMATLRIAFLSSFVLELLATLSVALVAVGVGLRLVDGGMDLRTGILVIVLAPEAYLPLRLVGARYHAAAEGLAATDRVFEILDTPLCSGGGGVEVPDLRHGGEIEARGLSVRHVDRPGFAPENVSLVASTGSLVVVTGASGAGKTTLLSVLLGTRRADAGGVVVRGGGVEVPLSSLDRDEWRRRIAWVDQSPYLFEGTVADNVRLAAPAADDDAVRRSLDAAGLAHVDGRRGVGEGGSALSAGEQRRVAMARAVLRDAPLVLLDEPTAGLDEDNERGILSVVRAMADRAIVVMVSHRPAAIALADIVVHLDDAGAEFDGLRV